MRSTVKLFGGDGGERGLPWLSNQLERSANRDPDADAFGEVVDAAREVRNFVVSREMAIQLKRSDKIRLLKLMNKAKVRALLRGDEEGYRIFGALDSIGNDLLQSF